MQAFGQGINRNQPAGMDQVAFFQRLPFRRFEDKTPVKQLDLAAEHDFHIRLQRFSQVGIIKPHRPHIPSLITDNSLGAAPSARHYDLCFPDIGNDGFFLSFAQLGNCFHLAVIDVAAGEKVEQVADRFYTQLAEFIGETGGDALDRGNRSIQRRPGNNHRSFRFQYRFF